MNEGLGRLCAHIIGYTGPGETLEDGDMNEMTLLSWPDTGFEIRFLAEHPTSQLRRLPTMMQWAY